MSTILPINDSIVPASVTKSYIDQYDAKTQQRIEDLFQTIKTAALSKITDAPQQGASVFVLVAGSQGVGKSRLANRLVKNREEQFVECDVDSILAQMPEVTRAIKQVEQDLFANFRTAVDYNPESHRSAVDEAVERMRPAAKYISDRLMSESVQAGYNVMVETGAKSPQIKDFLQAVKKTGVVLEGHICEAPNVVKVAGARSPQHGFAYPAKVLEVEYKAFRDNMKTIAQECSGNLTIWWRQDAKQPLLAAAVATKAEYKTNAGVYAGFNAYFMDREEDLSVEKLMGPRKLSEAALSAKVKEETLSM